MKYSLLVLALMMVTSLVSVAHGQRGEELTPIKADNKWGYANKKGKVVVAPAYDRALPFKNGIAKVGLRNPQISEDVEDFAFLWGMIDTTGRVIVKPEYNYLRDFSEGLAAVAKIQDTKGNRRQLLSDSNLLWGFIDQTGSVVVPPQYYRAGDFSEGLAAVGVADDSGGMCEREGKFGYVDKSGSLVIKPKYITALPFNGGKARVGIGIIDYVGRCRCCNPEFRGTWGSVDKSGNFTADKSSQ